MRLTRTLFTAAAACAVLGGEATAASSVTVESATTNGDRVAVSGSAVFPVITGPQSVVGTGAQRTSGAVAGTAAGEAAGLALADATIEPLANGSGLRFAWRVASLPDQVPPEGVRYTWAFKIGGRLYQLQAKRTNVLGVSTIEDPVGHVQHAAKQQDFFQLRGACVPAYLGTPVQGCYHLAFLAGRFDIAGKTITIDLPYETRDGIGRLVAPDFKPGAVLLDNAGESTAGMVIAASFQAVVSNTTVSRYINNVDPYYVGPRVELGLGPAAAHPAAVKYTSLATLEPNGRYSGSVGGVTAQANTLFVRACNGTQCAYAQQAL